MKKALSIILSLVMLISVTAGIDLSANAASFPNKGKCGTNVSYTFNSTNGVLTISGSGDMKNYTIEDASPFEFNSNDIKKIIIGSGVTSIGNRAFSYCEATSVSISNTVKTIGEYAFKSCKKITSITIPNSVKVIKKYAFDRCYGAKNITIGTGVTTIEEGAFYHCYGTTSITVPSSVKNIDYSAFDLVNNVKYYGSLDSGRWGQKSLNGYIEGNYVFNSSAKTELLGCSTYATSVSIPSSVKAIGKYAFFDCNQLTSISIPNSVTSIGEGAFEYCDSLVSVSISNRIKEISSWTFSDCHKLKTIAIPSSVDTIGWGAFYGCVSLFNFVIPDTVTTIKDSAFSSIKNVKYNGQADGSPWGAQAVNGYVDSYLVYKDSRKKEICGCRVDVKKVVIPKSVTKIDENAFYRCYDLKDTYYMGNQSLWDTILIEYGNTSIIYSEMHYNYIPPCKVCTNKKNYVTKATTSANGSIVYKCATCGTKYSTTTVPKVSSFKLSATNYNYDGKVKTPAVTVKDSKGKTLRKGTDYDVTYSSGRKNVGKYAVKITLKGNYYGTKTLYFNINPRGTTIAKLTPKSRAIAVQWKKQTNQTTGYQIQYSVYSNFKSAKTITMPKNTYYAKSITGLSGNKRYYVRVRTYKTVKFNGKNYNLYSPWSSAKYTTTKR